MTYPNRIVEAGDTDPVVVRAVEDQLIRLGYSRTAIGVFDSALTSLVSLFQAQNSDLMGRPLKVDGRVGPNTWGALFAVASSGGLLDKIVAVAQSQVGVSEVPPGSNRGPQVEAYLKSVGLGGGYAWCMAFVHWCVREAAAPGPCPAPADGGVLSVLQIVQSQTPARFISKADVIAAPQIVKPGWVFIQDHGHSLGHTGIVKSLSGGGLTTIEGNTSPGASREGLGVFELTRRSITDAELVGFIDFSR